MPLRTASAQEILQDPQFQTQTVTPQVGGTLTIVTIDIGQGDSTLIIGPNGKTMLYDCGVPLGAMAAQRDQIAQHIKSVCDSFNVHNIDYFVAGHYHTDHLGDVPQLFGLVPFSATGISYDRGGNYNSSDYTNYVSTVGSHRRTIPLDQVIDFGQGCTMTCVAVDGHTDSTDLNSQIPVLIPIHVEYNALQAASKNGNDVRELSRVGVNA